MNTLELKPNQQIGVFYYDDRRGSKALIEEVERISETGVVTLKNGIRYTPKGKEIGATTDPTYLCSIEQAQAVINKAAARKLKKEEEHKAYLSSPKGKRDTAAKAAVRAAIQTLNQHGWYADVDGDMDVLKSELEQKILSYLERHEVS